MRRREQTPINFWKCGHFSPVVIEEAEGGNMAGCLLCVPGSSERCARGRKKP